MLYLTKTINQYALSSSVLVLKISEKYMNSISKINLIIYMHMFMNEHLVFDKMRKHL